MVYRIVIRYLLARRIRIVLCYAIKCIYDEPPRRISETPKKLSSSLRLSGAPFGPPLNPATRGGGDANASRDDDEETSAITHVSGWEVDDPDGGGDRVLRLNDGNMSKYTAHPDAFKPHDAHIQCAPTRVRVRR